MIPRGTVIATLLAIEVAIIGVAVVAVQGGQVPSTPIESVDAQAAVSPRLVEGGPHQIFDAGQHPALTVDIGNADLTILTSKAPQIDVSVSPSTAYGSFRATAPIEAQADRQTVRIATTERQRWSMGDDRMVTVVVPPETRVTVLNAGDINATGLRAAASLNSIGAGTVTVEDYDAPALQVASKDGRISMHQIAAGHVDVTSSDGRVEGTALHVRDGTVESDGPVTLGFATGADTLVNANTSDGKVNVSGFATEAVAAGHKSGDDSDDDSSSRTVRVGAGSGHLDVHASDGDINLAQES